MLYGLEPGQYRLALKTPKDQIISVEYTREKSKKRAAYKKSKAINIKSDIDSVYTSTEKAARWYKVSVSATKTRKAVTLSKDSVGGGFKLRVYQKGKLLKTVKIAKNDKVKTVKLPKKKGTYYVKVTKLTSKTTMKKAARKTEPAEWNQKEIKAYKFGNLEDALYYALSGGIKYYDQNYFKNPEMIKITAVESGALGLAVVGDSKQEGVLYDSNKKMI